MVDSRYRQQYQPRYGTGQATDVGSSQTPVPIHADNLGVEGQLTTLRVYADNDVGIQVKTVEIDTGDDAVPFNQNGLNPSGTPTTRINLTGQSVYNLGDFENPALEVGAYTQIQIIGIPDDSGSGKVSVNTRVDERTG